MTLPTPPNLRTDSEPANRKRIRLLIADDHSLVRSAIKALLETEPSITVVAEAADGTEAWTKITEFQPDVALVDVEMPRTNGIELTQRITTSCLNTRVVALTAYEDDRHVRDSLAAGAVGYVPKSAAATELRSAIHAVVAGHRYIHPHVSRVLLNIIGVSKASATVNELSSRETEVMRLIALGYANKEIAAKLQVSVKTVETYKARGMEKVGATSRVEIVRFATTQGWFDAPGE
jgi:DNA-binding NarL/FixJ family response regulator